jgi:hypothetical protein
VAAGIAIFAVALYGGGAVLCVASENGRRFLL